MAEAVGLIASVIAITAAVVESVRHVKTFYQALEELQGLQVSYHVMFHNHEMTISGASRGVFSLDMSDSGARGHFSTQPHDSLKGEAYVRATRSSPSSQIDQKR